MFCNDISEPIALIFSDETPKLLYYSHLPVLFVALIFGLLILLKNKSLESRLLLAISSFYSLWIFVDLVNWTNIDSRIVIVSWSFMNLLFLLVLIFLLYFSYVFLYRKDISARCLIIGSLPVVLYAMILPTAYNISGFDLAICEATQTHFEKILFHLLQTFYYLWLLVFLIRHTWHNSFSKILHRDTLFSIGVAIFASSFYIGNNAAVYFDKWELEQYGLFGMFIFLSFLVILIVRYRAFNLKILGAQALVAGLIVLIGSELFFVTSTINYILVVSTFVLSVGFGIILVRSVQGEVRRKEELQIITNRLAEANAELRRLDTAKSEFISIASHQLRTPLTAIKGFVSLLLEGAYGKLEPSIADTLNKVYLANARLMNLVENLLNISRIESGRIQYQFAPAKIESILDELNDIFGVAAHEKGVVLNFKKGKKPLPMATIDAAKVREVISNLIDNALKYTESGTVTIEAVEERDGIQITISDTGVGIEPDDLPRLFHKFERGRNSAQVNVSSTGLGLYVSKRFVEAHGGTIIGESQGHGKGSKFTVWLPFQPVKKT